MEGGRYSKMFRRMWNDEKFRRLSRPQPCGQSLWMRFLCGPELGPIPGLFCAREPGLADAMGWSLKPFRESFLELSSNGLAKADWVAGLVWIPNAIRYNEPANPNVVKSWSDAWAELPECELKSEAHSRLCDYMRTRGESFLEVFINHCPNHCQNHCPNQEQEQEQEQDQEDPPNPQGGRSELVLELDSAAADPSRKVGYSAAFEAVWKLYGRKEEKSKAYTQWRSSSKIVGGEIVLRDLVLAALSWQGPMWAADAWKYAKYFERYLKARKWEDARPPRQVDLTKDRDIRVGQFRAEIPADPENLPTGDQPI